MGKIARFQQKSNIQMTIKSTILKITLLKVSSEYPIIAFSKNFNFGMRGNTRF